MLGRQGKDSLVLRGQLGVPCDLERVRHDCGCPLRINGAAADASMSHCIHSLSVLFAMLKIRLRWMTDASCVRIAPLLTGGYPMTKIRLLLVEDNRLLREGLTAMLNGQPDMEVVAAFGNGKDAVLKATQESQPQIILLRSQFLNQKS